MKALAIIAVSGLTAQAVIAQNVTVHELPCSVLTTYLQAPQTVDKVVGLQLDSFLLGVYLAGTDEAGNQLDLPSVCSDNPAMTISIAVATARAEGITTRPPSVDIDAIIGD